MRVLDSVHGEYRFSSLEMPPPERSEITDGRLTGISMRDYFETFSATHLFGKAKFLFHTQVLNVQRTSSSTPSDSESESDFEENEEKGRVSGSTWEVRVLNLESGKEEVLEFSRIVLATGVRPSQS